MVPESKDKRYTSLSEWLEGYAIDSMANWTPDKVNQTLTRGSLSQKRALSRHYFQANGLYREVMVYYASLLLYKGLLIPSPKNSNNISSKNTQKKYSAALEYIKKSNLPSKCFNWALDILVYGGYCGIITDKKDRLVVIDLPATHCRSLYKTEDGEPTVEFDLSYFDSIEDSAIQKKALNCYPSYISRAYKKFKNNKIDNWYMLPIEDSICFNLFNSSTPPFLDLIPAIIGYESDLEMDRKRNKEELKKIIVHKIPHLTDGTLLFQPEEVEVIHKGVCGMLKGNENIDVFTTYGEAEILNTKTTNDSTKSNTECSRQDIFMKAGVSQEIFSATASSAIPASTRRDLAFCMVFANKFAAVITKVINKVFGNSSLSFTYIFLPISYQNQYDYIDKSLSLANGGYSLFAPSIAMGIDQKDLVELKQLENTLGLTELLKPLNSAFQQSQGSNDDNTDERGAPELPLDQKSDKTITNIDAQ